MKLNFFAAPPLLLLFSVAGAAAQTVNLGSAAVNAFQAQADELHEKAVRLHGDAERIDEAVQLHELSGKLRLPGDPRAFDSFKLATQLYLDAGRVQDARHTMQKAADWSVRRGDVNNEARCYVALVMIAEQQKRPADVIRFARHVQHLASAPEISATDRGALLVRISRPLAAALDRR